MVQPGAKSSNVNQTRRIYTLEVFSLSEASSKFSDTRIAFHFLYRLHRSSEQGERRKRLSLDEPSIFDNLPIIIRDTIARLLRLSK